MVECPLRGMCQFDRQGYRTLLIFVWQPREEFIGEEVLVQNKNSVRMENMAQERTIHTEYSQKQKDLIEEVMIRSDMSYSKIMHHMDVNGFRKRFKSGPYEGLVDEICNSIFMPSVGMI